MFHSHKENNMAFKMRGWAAFDAVGSGLFGGGNSKDSGKELKEDGGEVGEEVKYNAGAASIGQMISKQQLKR